MDILPTGVGFLFSLFVAGFVELFFVVFLFGFILGYLIFFSGFCVCVCV